MAFYNSLGGGRLTATYQLSTDPDLITRVVAEYPAVELPDRRDETTRVWEMIREVETTHPDGSETTDIVASYVIEKGSGLCYRDERGNLLPASPRWVESGGGFAVTECAYGVSAGTTLATPLSYVVKGRELALRPAHLMASDGSADWHVAELDMDVAGALDPLRPNVLTFVGAFGEGIDVELVADKGALHQNLIIRNPLSGVYGGARIYLYTEIGLSDFVRRSAGKITIAGDDVGAADPVLSAAAGPEYPIVFSVPDASAGGYEPLHSFDQSPVTDSSQTGEHSPLDFADRTLLRDAATGIDYLVESIPVSSLEGATYPVVWDWVSVPQSPVFGTWEPRYTYHITSICSVAPGQTLTILPGTTVKFGAVNKLTVPASAKLVAKGEPYNYITFTSWKDDNSGEDLTPGQSTSGAPGDYDATVEIQYQASPECVIQYAKMGYGIHGIQDEQTIQPIRHNIIRDFSYSGISIYVADTSCQNNLIARSQAIGTGGTGIYCASLETFDLSNNTIDWCSTAIYAAGESHPTVTDNLLTEYDIGIYGPSGVHPDYNAYYSTRPGHLDTAPPGGCQKGDHDVDLGTTPYDTSLAETLGGHYLTEDAVGVLKDAGSKPAAEAALDAEVFAIRKPKSPPATINFKDRWSKVCYDSDGAPYSLDLGTVCIGYHHNRIDRHLTSDVAVTGTGGSLSIAPGVVVSMYWSSTEGRYVKATSGGKIVCEGMRRSPEYILLTRAKPASMNIESVRYGDSVRGFVKIESTASANCRVGFTKFQWSSALMLYKSLTNPIESNIFNLSYGGIVTSDCQNHYLNNVVHWNLVNGLQTTRGSTTITNCTFDENGKGIYASLRGGISLTVRNSLFTRSDYGLYVREGATYVTEGYNGFWANTTNYYPGPLAQSDKPLGIGECPYQWTAGDPADERSTWYLEQDPALLMDEGDGTPEANGLSGFSTSRLGAWDQANVDIGYHYYHYADTDSDGIPDNWEYQYCPQGQNWVGEWSSGLDPDNDGLANYEEFVEGTRPFGEGSWDSDNDGLPDGFEVRLPTEYGPADTFNPDTGYNVKYVDSKNTGPGTAGTYEDPYKTIRDGIQNSVAGSYVFVLPGMYTQPTSERPVIDKSITLQGSGAVRTIIDGGPDQANPSFGVVRIQDGVQAVVKGFTIQRGFNEHNPNEGYGGGLTCGTGSSLTLAECIVSGNVADWGAGVSAQNATLDVSNCLISGNASASGLKGGGIYVSQGSLRVAHSALVGNIAGDKAEADASGGGAIYCNGTWPTLEYCLISHNTARETSDQPSDGGGLLIENAGTGLKTIKNCIIRENRARNHGGGIYLSDVADKIELYNSIISGNSAGTDPSGGGGGIYMTNSYAWLFNCTVAGNAPSGIEAHSISADIYNFVLWNNAGNDVEGDYTVFYSDTEEAVGGTGNLHLDPQFVFTGRGPYHIAFTSPCVDTAYQTIPAQCAEADVDGDPRSIPPPPPNHIDMGADEANLSAVVLSISANEYDSDSVDLTWKSVQGNEYRVYFSSDPCGERARWGVIGSMTAGAGGQTTWTDAEAYPQEYDWGFYRIAEVDGESEVLSEPVGFVSVEVARSDNTATQTAFSVPLQTPEEGINEADGPGRMIVDCLPPGAGTDYYDYVGGTNHRIGFWHEIYTEFADHADLGHRLLDQVETHRWLFSDASDPRDGKWLTEPTYVRSYYSPGPPEDPNLSLDVYFGISSPERKFAFLDQSLVGTTVWVTDPDGNYLDSATVAGLSANDDDLSDRQVIVTLSEPLSRDYVEWSKVFFDAVDKMDRGRSFVLTLPQSGIERDTVTFFGYVPLQLFEDTRFGYWHTSVDIQDFEVSFSFPYPVVTNLNVIPFTRFGAVADDPNEPLDAPDSILVWPLHAPGWQELRLDRGYDDPEKTLEDGTWVWMSGPTTKADLSSTTVKPGSGFRFVTTAEAQVSGSRPVDFKYLVTQRPYY